MIKLKILKLQHVGRTEETIGWEILIAVKKNVNAYAKKKDGFDFMFGNEDFSKECIKFNDI